MSALARFDERGHAGPFRILDAAASHRFLAEVMATATRTQPLDWEKGWGAASRPFYALACNPALLAPITELLGNDVILWGASIVRRGPGEVHAWHSDVESSAPGARTLTVWLGLEHCGANSSLDVISGSHRFGQTIQELRALRGIDRSGNGPADVLAWAEERAPGSRIEALVAHDGEAVLFDGRLWHGSDNRSRAMRTALLLQYATPDTPIRIPLNYDWPFRSLERPLPPCVVVSGTDHARVNRIVPGPAASGVERGPRLTSQVHPLTLPLAPDPDSGWRPYPLLRGTTAGLHSITCHASALAQGRRPHPPHRHDEEELLLVLSGEADVLLPDLASGQERQRLGPGEFVFYPPQFAHTIEGVSTQPVNYMMLKWLSDPAPGTTPLGFVRQALRRVDASQGAAGTGAADASHGAAGGFRTERIFEGPTSWLHKLHCHVSTLAPGAGYEPHTDAYDVAIIVLDGDLECLEQRLQPHGVYFFAAGELHGARNPGAAAVHYVVFEFHARPTRPSDQPARVPLWRKLADPRRWRRRLGAIARRLAGE